MVVALRTLTCQVHPPPSQARKEQPQIRPQVQGITFRSFHQVDLHYSLWWGLPSPHKKPHHRPRLLQRLYSLAVHYLGDVYLIHPQYTVIHPVPDTEQAKRRL